MDGKDHMRRLKDINASERMPMGRVSEAIYTGVFGARQFDKYRRLVPNKMSQKQQMIADIQASFAAKSLHGGGYNTDDRAKISTTLITTQKDIGLKAEVTVPTGQAGNPGSVLNSEGMEVFFSYDGNWANGRPHGYGVYLFADGLKYEGSYREGWPEGHGVGNYANGTVYEGNWRKGRFDGKGTLRHGAGMTYEGDWKEGRRHGDGKLTLKGGATYEGKWYAGKQHGRGVVASLSGFHFTGTFYKGFINGPGHLVPPQAKKGEGELRMWNKVGGMTFRETVQVLDQEKDDVTNEAIKERDRLHGVNRALDLRDYVEDVRAQMKEELVKSSKSAYVSLEQ